MTITPYDFYRMTGLQFDGALITLEGESGTWLSLDFLGRRYATETICYTNLEADFMCCPQVTAEECVKMVRVCSLYLLEAYFFTNKGQTMSLRWLALFQDFERARDANWGQACLAYFYSSLDTLSQGTLYQLAGPWKLLEVSFSSFSLVNHAFSTLAITYTHMSFRLTLCIIFLLAALIFASCKLSSYKLPYLYLANYAITSCKLSYLYLVNYAITSYKPSFYKLLYLYLANCHFLLHTIPCSLANCHLANFCFFSAGSWSTVILLRELRWIWRASPRFRPISTSFLLMM